MARYSLVVAASVALSALVALAVTPLSPVTPVRDAVATRSATDRVEAAHAIVGAYLKMTAEARLAADHAADAELAASRRLAAEQAQRTAAVMPKQLRPVHIAKAVPLPEPLPAPAALQPVQLQAPPHAGEQADRKRPVLSRVAGTIGDIPRWVSSSVVDAASWVIALPSQAVARLPERRFL